MKDLAEHIQEDKEIFRPITKEEQTTRREEYKKMLPQSYYDWGKQYGLGSRTAEMFDKYMTMRWGNIHLNTSYGEEWLDRFKRREAWNYSDSKGRDVLLKLGYGVPLSVEEGFTGNQWKCKGCSNKWNWPKFEVGEPDNCPKCKSENIVKESITRLVSEADIFKPASRVDILKRKGINTTLIGSGKLPNKYYVTNSNDYYVMKKKGQLDWASEHGMIKKFKDFPQEMRAFNTYEEALEYTRSITFPEVPTEDTLNSIFIEDHISGEVFHSYILARPHQHPYEYSEEEDENIKFTKETMKEKGYVFENGQFVLEKDEDKVKYEEAELRNRLFNRWYFETHKEEIMKPKKEDEKPVNEEDIFKPATSDELKDRGTKRLVWATPEQVILWDAELSGQVSDGNWENAVPNNHYQDICRAVVSYSTHPLNQGTFNFRPKRGYNFADPEMLDVIGDRMFHAVKIKQAFPNASETTVGDWEYIKNYKETLEDAKKDKYWKGLIDIYNKDLGLTLDTYDEVISKIEATDYKWEDMIEDLKEMSKIISRSRNKPYESILEEEDIFKPATEEELAARRKIKMLKSLNDVLPIGNTEIWYWKSTGDGEDQGKVADYLMGYEWCKKKGFLPDPNNLSETHILLGKIAETKLDDIYFKMQGEFWSPNGEARQLIKSKGLNHTTMSVGDIIKIGDQVWFVDNLGFIDLNNEYNK